MKTKISHKNKHANGCKATLTKTSCGWRKIKLVLRDIYIGANSIQNQIDGSKNSACLFRKSKVEKNIDIFWAFKAVWILLLVGKSGRRNLEFS